MTKRRGSSGINAALLERAGAAVSLFGESFSAAAVHASVRRVLDDASFTAAAASIAREIASMPAPEAVAATLRQRFGP